MGNQYCPREILQYCPRAIFLRIHISSWIGGYNTDTISNPPKIFAWWWELPLFAMPGFLRVYGTATPPLFQGHHFGKETGVQPGSREVTGVHYVLSYPIVSILGIENGLMSSFAPQGCLIKVAGYSVETDAWDRCASECPPPSSVEQKRSQEWRVLGWFEIVWQWDSWGTAVWDSSMCLVSPCQILQLQYIPVLVH